MLKHLVHIGTTVLLSSLIIVQRARSSYVKKLVSLSIYSQVLYLRVSQNIVIIIIIKSSRIRLEVGNTSILFIK